MIRNTSSDWGSLSRWFHWILGIAIIGMIAYGWWMNHIPARPDRFFYRSIHADIGYVVLLLTVIRLIWRGINPTPALPDDTPRWQRIAARVSHGRSMPSPSWWRCWAGRIPARRTPNYSSLVRSVPRAADSPRPTRSRPRAYEDRHILFAYVLLALIVIHVAAARGIISSAATA